jgi:hypothetical protein
MVLPARIHSALVLVVAVSFAAVASSCNLDPIHTSQVEALGGEARGVSQGAYHRAGQPCLVCHGGEGPAKQEFAVAGTVFYGPGTTSPPIGVGGIQVTLEDDTQAQFTATTNCVGNFYVLPSDWSGHPEYPMLVTVSGTVGSYVQTSMQSRVGRNGSCASCHQYPVLPNTPAAATSTVNYFETPGIIYLFGQDSTTFQGTDPSCPVKPPIPAQHPGYDTTAK